MKKIAVLGTGMVGNTIGSKLIQLGYEVKMGSRTADNKNANEWVKKNGDKASSGTFDEAAEFGEMILLCIKGDAVITVAESINPSFVKRKTIIDISNPLDFSKGMPPSLIDKYSNTNSLSEELQKRFAEANIVKTLNIVSCVVMVDPSITKGEPTMFLCGNNDNAKKQVKDLLEQFGWKDIIDLGDITGARGMEMLLPIWVRTWGAINNGYFGFKILRYI